MKEVVKGFDRT